MRTQEKKLPQTLSRWNIPSTWEWVSIADIGSVITGNTPPTKDAMNYGNDIPFVKPPELLDKGIWAASGGLSQKGIKTARTLPVGAILVSCIGSLGKTGIAKVPVAFNQQINAIVFNDIVIPEYGFYYTQTLKGWLYDVASATTLPIVNKGKFQKAPFPLASPNEQTRIVAEIEKQFSRLDEAVAALKRIKANLKRYKASVLKAAVEGKLTEEWRKQHLPAPSSVPGKFYTYAILCDDDSIYIGHTDNITRRWKEHRDGQGAEWTKEHKPIKIAHYEEYETRQEAADREKWLKAGFGRKWLKRKLAAGRTRQAGDIEPASELLKRILTERRRKWEETELAKMRDKGKEPKDNNWKKKYKEPVVPDTANLPELPVGWAWTRLDAIAKLKGGITVDKKRIIPNSRNVAYLRVANVQRGYLDLSEIKEIQASEADIEALRLRCGDILFNEGGDRDKLGRGWVWEDQLPECIHQNHVFRARLFLPTMSSKFVSWWGNTFGKNYFLREGKQTTNLASVNLTKLSAFPVPLLSLLEQQVITEEAERLLSVAEEIEAEIETNLKRTQRLRQSVLKKAFSGKLVAQEANN